MSKKYKKILSIDDLFTFCKQNGLLNFNAEESGYKLRVQVPAYFEKKESDDKTLYGYIKIMHTGRNRNDSDLTEKAAKHCMETLAYKPLLANFTDVNGEWDFTSHDFIKTEDEDGNEVIEYQERQIGCFTADKPYMEYDEKYGHNYIYGRVAIPREYTKAAEIIERKNGTKVSAELDIYEMSFSAKDNVLKLNDAELFGCTCLGVDPETGKEVGEGMVDAHISLESFSEKNNSIFSEDLVTELRKFNKNFEALNINQNLGGKNIVNKFEELLAKYNKTAEDVEFDHENLTDEELEAKFEEVFGSEATNETGDSVEENGAENSEDNSNEGSANEFSEEGTSDNSEDSSEDEGSEDDSTDENEGDNSTSQDFSIITPDGKIRNFSLSLGEVENALYNLVNDTYSEIDNDIYMVDVYPDDSKVVMCGWFSGAAYRQSYKRKKDNFSLEGERISVHRAWLSEDEEKSLESMKANYSSIEDKLNKYEAEPEKLEILNSEDYAGIRETSEFAEISKRENYFELDKEDLTKKLDEIMLSYAKRNSLKFSENNDESENKPKISIKPLFGGKTEIVGRYGGVFSKK